MKITNVSSGKSYHLQADTLLEIERTNLFFNDYGEQSLPVDLPDTSLNRELCGYPGCANNRKKPARIECSIQAGGYYAVARQAILGAREGESINCSFYLNEGAFLSKMKDVRLKDIFQDEVVEGVSGVLQCLDFCRSLLANTDERFAIFPILVEDEEWKTAKESNLTYLLTYLNRMLNGDFYMKTSQTVIRSDDTEMNIDAGYYITPFIRVNYLLKRVMLHFGYTLLPSFFSNTSPFDKMVLLNTTADTLANGVIRMTDLLPDVSCEELLEAFRKRFFCEFIPNEAEGTVEIRTFNECISGSSTDTLDGMLVGHAEIEYPESYKEIVLTCGNVESPGDLPVLSGLKDAKDKYPSALLTPEGSVKRQRFRYYQTTGGTSSTGQVVKGGVASDYVLVSAAGTPFDMDTGLEKEEIEVPDTLPEYADILTGNLVADVGDSTSPRASSSYLYAGAARWLNSRLLEAGETAESASSEGTDVEDEGNLPVIFAFCKNVNGETTKGCLSLDGYSLAFNGIDGIFEKFYRNYDTLLRNSLHTVRANLLLTDDMKLQLDAHRPVSLLGHKMLWNVMNYTLGGKNEPTECELLTTQVYEPEDYAPTPNECLPAESSYRWVGKTTYTEISKSEYEAATSKDLGSIYVYPDTVPTQELYDAGTRICQRTWCGKDPQGAEAYSRMNFWLEVEKVE